MSYNVPIRRLQGGAVLEVADGGEIRLNGGTLTNNGTQAAAITDASEYSGIDLSGIGGGADEAATLDDLNALRVKFNTLLAALRGAGIIAS
jgi:hypothetical protein